MPRPLFFKGDDIVYSPHKYRETEGIKEILRFMASIQG
nr:MAG TPA: hypothetical protein [Caudoviricetes sp.]